jgi:tRNA(Ile2) C34 agmatinyltransferase TiaS
MGKKFTMDDMNRAYEDGVEAGAAVQRALTPTEPVSTEEHGSYTLTVRYKHTKYAGDDTDFTTSLVKELAEDEFRFVTDHFDVLSVEVNADTLWQG